jgi:hypothetical protein
MTKMAMNANMILENEHAHNQKRKEKNTNEMKKMCINVFLKNMQTNMTHAPYTMKNSNHENYP